MEQSSLSRYRLAVLAVTALAAGCSIYYIREHFYHEHTPRKGLLRRSNAVHHRRTQHAWRESGEPAAREPAFRESRNTASDIAIGEGNDSPGADAEIDNESKKDGQNLLNLLYYIAEDQSRKDGYVHRQVTCNQCNTHPIRGIRYRCANCVDYDLCEQCESTQVHTPTHIFYKVRIPAPFPFLGNPRQPEPVWYPGKPAGLVRQLSRDRIQRLSKKSRFEDSEIAALWDQFRCLASRPLLNDPFGMAIDHSTFDRCFMPNSSLRSPPPNLIYDLMFSFYDTDGNGLIGFEEFVTGLACLREKGGKVNNEKLRRVFTGYDLDRDGFVSRKDFLRMFRAYYALMKELTRELITGMEEDAADNGQSAREIAASSQPLSSAFHGHIPRGQTSRTGEGKTLDRLGDLILPHGQEVTRDSHLGEGDHHEAIGDVAELDRFGNVARAYIRNRLRNVSLPETPDTIADIYNLGDTVLDDSDSSHDSNFSEYTPDDDRNFTRPGGDTNHGSELQPTSTTEAGPQWMNSSNWPPDWINPSDAEEALGQDMLLKDITDSTDRSKVARAAMKRIAREDRARRQSVRTEGIQVRWQRRHFYLDEEDGATQPEGYNGESSEPAVAENTVEPVDEYGAMTGHSRASRRSRSSSKVRFEDDVINEPLTSRSRSSTSVSSRSIPIGERWGGFEIPEPEKDVGREVLYQVTHEALNEMLDPIFKYREDLAMAVLDTRSQRAHSRSRWQEYYNRVPRLEEFISAELHELLRQWQTVPESGPRQARIQASDFLQFLQEFVYEETISGETANRFFLNMCEAFGMKEADAGFRTISPEMPSQTSMPVPDHGPQHEGVEDSKLEMDGKTSEALLQQVVSVEEQPLDPTTPAYQDDPHIVYPEPALDLQAAVSAFNEIDSAPREADVSSKRLSELLAESGYTVATPESSDPPATPPEPEKPTLPETEDAAPDPTLPQNRPDSLSPIVEMEPAETSKRLRLAFLFSDIKPRKKALPEEPIPPHTVKYYAFLDCIEKEDKHRGGPGRINYEEFEQIMMSEGGKSLSFVGAWIDLASF